MRSCSSTTPGKGPLYSTVSAEEALWLAVDAQRDAHWPTLLRAALHSRDMACVVAGVVLSRPLSLSDRCLASSSPEAREFLCVSLGSGTRCVGLTPGDASGSRSPESVDVSSLIVRDGHAEVMARRGFVAFLLDAAARLTQDEDAEPSAHPFVERARISRGHEAAPPSPASPTTFATVGFALRSGVQAHLVCTHWPCGALGLVGTGTTGAKVILETPTHCLTLPAGLSSAPEHGPASTARVGGHVLAAHHSALDQDATVAPTAARVKPGKGHGNLNMSCTDKVWRWSALGLQGRRRLCLFPEPILLSSLHVVQQTPPQRGDVSTASPLCHVGQRIMAFRDDALRAVMVPPRTLPSGARSSLVMTVTEVHWVPTEGRTETAEEADSRYSRAAWVQCGTVPDDAHVPHTGTKRPRDDGSADGSVLWCPFWRAAHTATINTKAGLPQGTAPNHLMASLQAFRRRHPPVCGAVPELGNCPAVTSTVPATSVASARDAVQVVRALTGKYTLSRAWFGQRVLELLLRADGTVRCCVCHDAFVRTIKQSTPEVSSDPAGWFFTVALRFLDTCLSGETEKVVVREADGGTRVVCTGGSPPHCLYAAPCATGTLGVPHKPEATVLWVEKTPPARPAPMKPLEKA